MTVSRHRLNRIRSGLTTAAAGAAMGAASVLLAGWYGANRPLVAAAVVLALLTVASAVDWIAERLHRDIRTVPTTATPAPGSATSELRTLEPPETAARKPAATRPAGDWVDLADLIACDAVRELQCGACASFDVLPATADGRTLDCHRCGRATHLDPSGGPHQIRVRSNPNGRNRPAGIDRDAEMNTTTRPDSQEVPR